MRGAPGVLFPPARSIHRLAVLALTALLAACSVEPRPIHLGSEECSHCRMVIDDPQFVAQALNTKGKAYNFDAVECLADWVLAGEVAEEDLHSIWVADASEPGRWIPVEEAVFLRSPDLRSPMGMGLVAHASVAEARARPDGSAGETLGWDEVLRLVGERGGSGHHGHAHR